MTQKNPNHKVGRLVIVDDEAELMTALSEMLASAGYETAGFTSGSEALKILKEQDYDLLLTDMMMPEMDGIELLRAALSIDPDIVGIVMTGQGTVQTAVEAMKTGAFDYILKPFKLNVLLPVLSRAMEVRRLRMENMQLRETLAIHELGKAIAFSYDLNLILNKITDAALQQCDADEVSVMLPSHDRKELYVAAVQGKSSAHLGEHMQIDQGIAGWVAQNREPVTLHGEVKDRRFTPIKPRADIRAAVSIPMLARGNLVGVLNVNITHSRRPFTLGQIKALSILVNIVAPILENTNLYTQIQQAEERYRNIFENALEGIYQSTPDGAYITVNPVFASMFGYASPQEMVAEVSDIQKQLYVNPEDQTIMQHLMETEGIVRGFEVERFRKNGSHFWVSINVRAVRDGKGNIQYYEGSMEDITYRKQAEKRQKLVNNTLETLNRHNDVIYLIRDILFSLKEHTGIEAVGVRLREGEDFPYYVVNGFPPDFLEAERYLCARDDAGNIIQDSQGNPYLECMCGNIISGRNNPALSFFTKGGSFWTNSTTKLLASTSEEDRLTHMRNRCNSEGYESVALIPLRSGDDIIGLLQLNDKRQDRFTIKQIEFLEGISASIGIAVARKRAAEVIRESEELYRILTESAFAGVYVIQDGKFKFVNAKAASYVGYTREELTGKEGNSFVYAEDAHKVKEYAKKMLKGEQNYPYEFRIVTKEEGIRWVMETVSSILYKGKPAILGNSMDITERKHADEWLLRERSLTDRIMKTSPAGITVVNHEGQLAFANKRAGEILRFSNDQISRQTFDFSQLQITDFDGAPVPREKLPYMQVLSSGNPVYGMRQAIVSSDGSPVYLSINGAPIFDDSDRITEVVMTIDDITNQKKDEETIKQSIEKLQKTLQDMIKAMSKIVEMRDPYTAGHQERVAGLAVAMAEEMGLSKEQIEGIRMAGMIHDIGKMYVPAEILSKPSKLSDIEFIMVKMHARMGYEILKSIEFPYPIAEIVYQHHERLDGIGYPRGLSNGDILLESMILAVADVVEAMASHRPYRPSLGMDEAIEEISRNRGILYDPKSVDACLRLIQEQNYRFV